nr:zf-CCHC domain-containing protein/UBN2 domain-containing protein [Tanacetum cinerariifolium]
MMKETPYELLKDNQKKQLGKNNKAKMTLYNALSRKEYERVFMCKTAKERAKVTTIEEAKDLATLPLDELISNHKVYQMILANDGVASKPIKEKVMSMALKDNVTRGQTSNDSVCQDRSKKDEDEEEEFKSIVKNLWNLFKKDDRFDRGHSNRSKGVGS